jgi:hypothetical protein
MLPMMDTNNKWLGHCSNYDLTGMRDKIPKEFGPFFYVNFSINLNLEKCFKKMINAPKTLIQEKFTILCTLFMKNN